jgi:hypothetical protein
MNHKVRDIPGYEGKYAITRDGLVVRFLKPRKSDKGYSITNVNGNKLIHRLLYETYVGLIPNGMQIDHINRYKTDNRLENLRLCTNSQNHANMGKIGKNQTSAYKGVCFQGGKWIAQIGHQGEKILIGRYDTELEAVKIYNKYALKLFGEFALLNDI